MKWLTKTLAVTFTVMVLPYLLPGIAVAGFMSALTTAVAIGVLNVLVRPLLIFFTLPLTVLTLGLFILALE